MDRSKKSDKSKKTIALLTQLGIVAIILTGIGFAYEAGYLGVHSKPAPKQAGKTAQAEAPHGLFGRIVAAVNSTDEKVAEISHALDENDRLRYENANLRLKLETEQFDCHEKEAMAETKAFGTKVSDQAGSRVARTLASIGYKPPENLLPNQLYTLGVTYFKAHEDEKAAVILSFLTNLDGNTAYQTARNYLMAGVAWYRMNNFDMARANFENVLKMPETDDDLPFQAQARSGKGLVAKHFAKEKEVQYWLQDLVDHHPHSPEAEWVNGHTVSASTAPAESKEREREPATSQP